MFSNLSDNNKINDIVGFFGKPQEYLIEMNLICSLFNQFNFMIQIIYYFHFLYNITFHSIYLFFLNIYL